MSAALIDVAKSKKLKAIVNIPRPNPKIAKWILPCSSNGFSKRYMVFTFWRCSIHLFRAAWIRIYSPRLSMVSNPTNLPLSITGSVWQLQSFSLAKADSSISRESTVTKLFCIADVTVGYWSRADRALSKSVWVRIPSTLPLSTTGKSFWDPVSVSSTARSKLSFLWRD